MPGGPALREPTGRLTASGCGINPSCQCQVLIDRTGKDIEVHDRPIRMRHQINHNRHGRRILIARDHHGARHHNRRVAVASVLRP